MILNKIRTPIFYVIALLAACAADKNASINIRGYDYRRMKEVSLEQPLKEISGIAYHLASHSFLAINDEKGMIYVLDAKTFHIKNKFSFGEEGDYEEIQVAENNLYVLRSDGVIYKMNFDGQRISQIETFIYAGPKAEYESFYIDAASNALILIPKQSKAGTKEKQTVTYTINASNGMCAEKAEHRLNWNDLKNGMIIHPSAVAVQPKTKDVYLLVSIEKKLIVLDAAWKLIAEYELDRNYFQQPEGIAFDAEGNLYITNEGGEQSPTLIQIPILPN